MAVREPNISRRRFFRGPLGRAQIERTNESGTCLWCGRKLRRNTRDPEHFGDYADNAFCGLRCGYAFGVIAARNGFRLKPYTGEDQ